MEKFKIVADSSADVLSLADVSFSSAPLKIITNQREYVDDADLDVKDMADTLLKYKGRSSTSCPNPDDWLKAFGEAQFVFCVTITATLSGSYNAALVAKGIYEDRYPERRVFVLNSLTAGPEIKLIIEKIRELIIAEKTFDEICEMISEYSRHTGLIFMLESMKNMANNGRVSPIIAKAAGLLGLRVVGRADENGDLQSLDKCRGQEKAIATIAERMKEFGYNGGRVRIAHCFNIEAAGLLKSMLNSQMPDIDIEIYDCRGLCGFYAEKGGVLIGFETD